MKPPGEGLRPRCKACGNLTRWNVIRTVKFREYHHYDLSGDCRIEEPEVLLEVVNHVECRWCNGIDTLEWVEKPLQSEEEGTSDAARP